MSSKVDTVVVGPWGNTNVSLHALKLAASGYSHCAGAENLQPLGIAGLSTQLWLAPRGQITEKPPTSVSLSDQGLVQVLEASVTGLEPGKPYVLALSNEASGAGVLEPLQGFMANPAGSAVVNAIGPIRQIVRDRDKSQRRYLVIAPGTVWVPQCKCRRNHRNDTGQWGFLTRAGVFH